MIIWQGLGILMLLLLIFILFVMFYVSSELGFINEIGIGGVTTIALLLNLVACRFLQKILTRYVEGKHTLYDLTPAQWGKGILILWLILYALTFFVEYLKH